MRVDVGFVLHHRRFVLATGKAPLVISQSVRVNTFSSLVIGALHGMDKKTSAEGFAGTGHSQAVSPKVDEGSDNGSG